MIKLGCVLTSHVYSDSRFDIATQSFTSLVKTNTEGLLKPSIVISNTTSKFNYNNYIEQLSNWNVSVVTDVDLSDIKTLPINYLQVHGLNLVLQDESITHVFVLPDDFIYNKHWLQELTKLIERHPDALAWAVYRSSYKLHYNIVGGDGTDVLMSANDAMGVLTKEEWRTYQDIACGNYHLDQYGHQVSLDVHHAYVRKGDRWATSRDYIQNIGVHDWLGRDDQAIDFVGEE